MIKTYNKQKYLKSYPSSSSWLHRWEMLFSTRPQIIIFTSTFALFTISRWSREKTGGRGFPETWYLLMSDWLTLKAFEHWYVIQKYESCYVSISLHEHSSSVCLYTSMPASPRPRLLLALKKQVNLHPSSLSSVGLLFHTPTLFNNFQGLNSKLILNRAVLCNHLGGRTIWHLDSKIVKTEILATRRQKENLAPR